MRMARHSDSAQLWREAMVCAEGIREGAIHDMGIRYCAFPYRARQDLSDYSDAGAFDGIGGQEEDYNARTHGQPAGGPYAEQIVRMVSEQG